MSSPGDATPKQASGVYKASGVSLVDGEQAPLQLDSSGNLKTTGGGGGGGNVTVVGSTPQLALDSTVSGIQQTHSGTVGNGAYILDPSTGLPITYTAPTNVNTAQVNGVTVLTGTGATGTGAQRVTVSEDTNTIAGSAVGTAGTASANVVTIQGVASMTAVATTIAADVAVQPATDNFVSGTASATNNSSTSLIGIVSGKSIWVTGYSISNTSATAITVSFQDGSGGTTLWTVEVPAGGGNNLGSSMPLFKTSSGNALYFAASTGETTIYANASGFSK